tara:strand:+ start:1320 stop:1502 length:183 start_codon:yes stop_codon:yes gene_type:complete
MNRSTNKHHCDLRHPAKKDMKNDEPLFDQMGVAMQITFLAAIILTAPLWVFLCLFERKEQ